MTGFTSTINSGFARSRSEAQFPRLFPDLGWWCPSLQPMGGTRLWDLSGRQNWGTLTSMDPATDWVISNGRGALDFDNTNDTVSMASIEAIRSGPFAVSCWYYPNTTSGINQIFAQWTNIGGLGPIAFRNGNALAWQIVNRLTTASVFTASVWHHIVCYRLPSGTLRAMVNGVLDAGSSTATNQSSTDPFLLGGPVSGAGTGAGDCLLDDVRIYRNLDINDGYALYRLGRGNMPIARRRRYTEQAAGGFQAYWARRQSQIIGAGV